jgi:hypothetical protein
VKLKYFLGLRTEPKSVRYSGFDGENRSSKRVNVNPLAGFLKPQSPTERLAAQHRDREKLQRERQLKELAEEARGKGKGRGCDEEARGAPMHAAPTSLLLFPHLCLPLCGLLLHANPSPLFPCF